MPRSDSSNEVDERVIPSNPHDISARFSGSVVGNCGVPLYMDQTRLKLDRDIIDIDYSD